MRSRQLWVVMLLATGSVCLQAQWLKHPAAGTPRAKSGKPNLQAPAPRLASGRPDLSGVWQAEPAPLEIMLKVFPDSENGTQALGESPASPYFANVLADFKPEEITMKPWAEALLKERMATNSKDIPSAKCLPLGLPLMDAAVFPHKILQMPGVVVVLYEELTTFRQIFTDGRKLPVDPQAALMGYSVGQWEKDWLVVEVAGFQDRGWLDAFGHPFSDAMRLTERFHRRDFGHMDVQVTIDDPKTYSKPFTFKFTKRLLPDTDLLESFCENEKDAPRLRG
jgi:hypothetical protein